jgi:hypothetical protein
MGSNMIGDEADYKPFRRLSTEYAHARYNN